jgi:hypothetical protein
MSGPIVTASLRIETEAIGVRAGAWATSKSARRAATVDPQARMLVVLAFVLLEKPGRLFSNDAVEIAVDDAVLGSALKSDDSELMLVELFCPVEPACCMSPA